MSLTTESISSRKFHRARSQCLICLNVCHKYHHIFWCVRFWLVFLSHFSLHSQHSHTQKEHNIRTETKDGKFNQLQLTFHAEGSVGCVFRPRIRSGWCVFRGGLNFDSLLETAKKLLFAVFCKSFFNFYCQ